MVVHGPPLLGRGSPLAIGTEFPASRRRVQRGLEQFVQVSSKPWILDLNQYLDPPVEVAVHHVGAADPELIDAIEMDDPRVFQESAENRANRNVLREAFHPRAQGADAA